MFYMQLLMNKRGPLAKIWLAAHWDKKVTKAHIFECNLEATIEKILSPKRMRMEASKEEFKIALRTSGHLLLGVVRIYHRKAKYLLADCNEALHKMQSSFRPGLVDLPKGNSEANYEAITLPEEFHDFDTQLPEVNAIDVVQHFTLNQSKAEDITLAGEDYTQSLSLQDNSFGEETEIPRHSSILNDSIVSGSAGLLVDSWLNFTGEKNACNEDTYALKYDGFGDEGIAGDIIDDVLGTEQNRLITDINAEEEIILHGKLLVNDTIGGSKEEAGIHQINETTLLTNEEEGFILEPVDETVSTRKPGGKRKRKLLVDPVKELSRTTMQKQLMNYEGTLTILNIAPPTRKLMILQESGSVDKLLSRPTQPLINKNLQMLFAKVLRNLRKMLQEEVEVGETSEEQDVQASVSSELQIIEQGPSILKIIDCQESQPGLKDGIERKYNNGNSEILEHQITILDNEEKRSEQTLELLNAFQHMNSMGAQAFSFLSVCKNKNSKEAAATFYSLLVLKKKQAIEVTQAAPYADIIVMMGPKFYKI